MYTLKQYHRDAVQVAYETAEQLINYEKKDFFFVNTAINFLAAIVCVILRTYPIPVDENNNELKPIITDDNYLCSEAINDEGQKIIPFKWKPNIPNGTIESVLTKPIDEIIDLCNENGIYYFKPIVKAYKENKGEQLQNIIIFLKELFQTNQ